MVEGLVISIGTGVLYLFLTGNQDNPVLGVIAILVPALVLLVVVFVIHLVLAPARLYQRALDSWESHANSIVDAWKESVASTIDGWSKSNEAMGDGWKESLEAMRDGWKESIDTMTDGWTRSNDAVGYEIRNLALLVRIKAAKGLREDLAASERGDAADDGELRALVDSWDGNSASMVRSISETEAEFYLRDSAVPKTPNKTWQGELRDFVLIRQRRLKEIHRRYKNSRTGGPVT